MLGGVGRVSGDGGPFPTMPVTSSLQGLLTGKEPTLRKTDAMSLRSDLYHPVWYPEELQRRSIINRSDLNRPAATSNFQYRSVVNTLDYDEVRGSLNDPRQRESPGTFAGYPRGARYAVNAADAIVHPLLLHSTQSG